MRKEIKIGNKLFIEMTTFYVFDSESDLQNDKPRVITSDKSLFDLYIERERVKDV